MVKAKIIPQRTCTGCREVQSKKGLIRIVRTPDKRVIVDPTGKANGRGAYICAQKACLEAAIKSKRLTRALEIEISPEDLNRIEEELEAVIETSGN